MRFQDILAEPEIAARFRRVREYFFLRESTYDLTSRCNLRCDGCYYYEGDKHALREEPSLERWEALARAEQERGITFVVLAGAEPSLVPERCAVFSRTIPHGAIATNGLRRIPEEVGYQIHISTWGNAESSKRIRGDSILQRQILNYAGDPRAVFIYTFTRENIDEAEEVVTELARCGARISFNQFSAPLGYTGPLRLDRSARQRMARVMAELMRRYPDNILYSDYNIEVHSGPESLHDRFRCPYPRRNPDQGLGLGRSFRQYRVNLEWDRSAACCVPDTDCADCRHYAAGSAIVTTRMNRHVTSRESFCQWLDYVDTYLAVWVRGYAKSPNLYWSDRPLSAPVETRSEASAQS